MADQIDFFVCVQSFLLLCHHQHQLPLYLHSFLPLFTSLLFVNLTLSLPPALFLPPLYLSLFPFPAFIFFLCLYICLSIYLSVCLSASLPRSRPACLPVRLFVCLSVCPSIYLSLCVSFSSSSFLLQSLNFYSNFYSFVPLSLFSISLFFLFYSSTLPLSFFLHSSCYVCQMFLFIFLFLPSSFGSDQRLTRTKKISGRTTLKWLRRKMRSKKNVRKSFDDWVKKMTP
jgi:hypothetical protein